MAVDIERAAAELWTAAAEGDHAPEAWLGRMSLTEALDVQLALLDRKLAAGESLGGWKVGLTSERARQLLGADERPFGHVLASRIHYNGDRVSAGSMHAPHIEPELCFSFGKRVESVDELRTSVSAVSAGYELNDSRPGSARPDFPLSVADNLSQWGIAIGDGMDPVGIDVNGIEVTLRCDGDMRYQGISHDVLDDHWSSLGRLVEVLAAHGRRIEAGQHVITGAFCRFPVRPGEQWVANYRGIGRVDITIVD